MKITLITVGKIKERFFEEAIKEYSKRLSRYCKLEIIQVADEKTPDGASETVEAQIKEKEGKRILSYVKDGSYVVALAIEGVMLSSTELAETIGKLTVDGTLSFSPMTFPHQLMRVVLLEQIYRSFRILTGEPYHK